MTDNGSRSMAITTPNPGVEGVRAAVLRYVRSYPDLSEPIAMYGAIMEVQQAALDGVECGVEVGRQVVADRMMLGEPLLDPLGLAVDPEKFRGLVEGICAVVAEKTPGGLPPCEGLLSWPGLSESELAGTREKVLKGESLEPGGEWSGHPEIVSRILWESMFPFFRTCGSALEEKIDHALWQKGYCPVCGGRPLMGEFREGDGLWLLECCLCHTLWNVQRASCPFCEGGSQGSLEYVYIDEDRSRRIQFCSGCRSYVKTIDLRDGERGVLLPLEDIATVRLDRVAKEEGLRPAEGRS